MDNTRNNDFRDSQNDFRDAQDLKSKVLRNAQDSGNNDLRNAQDSKELRDNKNKNLRDNLKNC